MKNHRKFVRLSALGHDAYSCDIQPCSGGHPEWHIQGNVLDVWDAGDFVTSDGASHYVQAWDLLIAHPPCTYLSNVATRAFSLRCTPAEKVCKRWQWRNNGESMLTISILNDIIDMRATV